MGVSALLARGERPYTASMNLKNAAFLALIGMLLLALVDAVDFFRDLSLLGQGAIAGVSILSSAIHLFASLTLALFLFVFLRVQV